MRIFLIVILSLTSFLWLDSSAALFFARYSSMKEVALSISWLCLPIMHLSISGTLFLLSRFVAQLKAYTIPLFEYTFSIGFIMFFCGILKLTIARARPHLFIDNGITGFAFGNFGNSFRSFPSSHTAVAVAIAILLAYHLGKKYRPLFFGFVLLIALTRMVLQKHFISDVLAGALIGQLVTTGVLSLCNKHQLRLNKTLETIL